MSRDWLFTPYYDLPLVLAIFSSGSKHVGSAIGDPRDAKRSCIVLHDSQLTVGATQTLRAPPDQKQRAAIFRASLRRNTRLCQATAHTGLL